MYEVSGEYAAIELMAREGLMKGPEAHVESWTALSRAGASLIITPDTRCLALSSCDGGWVADSLIVAACRGNDGGTGMRCQLHRIGAHSAGATMDQDRLSLFQVTVGEDSLPRSLGGNRH